MTYLYPDFSLPMNLPERLWVLGLLFLKSGLKLRVFGVDLQGS